MSRTKEGRDALRSSEAHPQARSIAAAWAERSQRRVPLSRHSPKSAETGEAHPLPGAGLRPVRRGPEIRPDCRRNRCPLSSAEGVLQHNRRIADLAYRELGRLIWTRKRTYMGCQRRRGVRPKHAFIEAPSRPSRRAERGSFGLVAYANMPPWSHVQILFGASNLHHSGTKLGTG